MGFSIAIAYTWVVLACGYVAGKVLGGLVLHAE